MFGEGLGYVMDAINRFELDSLETRDRVRDVENVIKGVDHRLKIMEEENRRRDEDRKAFQRAVLGILSKFVPETIKLKEEIDMSVDYLKEEKVFKEDASKEKMANPKSNKRDMEESKRESDVKVNEQSNKGCDVDELSSKYGVGGSSPLMGYCAVGGVNNMEEHLMGEFWKVDEDGKVEREKRVKFEVFANNDDAGELKSSLKSNCRKSEILVEASFTRLGKGTVCGTPNSAQYRYITSSHCSAEESKWRSSSSGVKSKDTFMKSELGPISDECITMTKAEVVGLHPLHGGLYSCGPFRVKESNLDMEETHVMEYIFDESLDPKESIITTKWSYITREMMKCLKPGGHVYDDLLNITAEYLTEFGRRLREDKLPIWYLTTRMSPEALGSYNCCGDDITRVHGSRDFFTGNLKECRTIMIPVGCKRHWLLYVVRVEEEIVEIWDSLMSNGRSVGESIVKSVMKNLDLLLRMKILVAKPPSFSFTSFKVVIKQNVPQQNNLTDCGVFVINFMVLREKFLQRSNQWKSEEERLNVCRQLVLCEYNKSKTQLIERAKDHFLQKDCIDDYKELPSAPNAKRAATVNESQTKKKSRFC